MPRSKRKCAKLTVQHCEAAVAQCKTRIELKRRFPSDYIAIRRNNWRHVLAPLPELAPKQPRKWTLDACKDAARQCASRTEYAVRFPGAYWATQAKGWSDIIDAILPEKKDGGSPQFWTKAECLKEALKYTRRVDFKNGCSSAASIAQKNGWMDDVCAHMKRAGTLFLRYVYVIREVGTQRVYVGLSINPKRRYWKHKSKPAKAMREFISGDTRMIVVSGLLQIEDAARIEIELINRFQSRGWTVMNSVKGGALGCMELKWNRDAVVAVSKTCRTRKEMFTKYRGAYMAAHRRGWLDELFADHDNQGYIERRVWTLEMLQALVDTLPDRASMHDGHQNAYRAAISLGVLDELYRNHPNNGFRYKFYNGDGRGRYD